MSKSGVVFNQIMRERNSYYNNYYYTGNLEKRDRYYFQDTLDKN
jgi:hypothetical protein